MPSPWTVYPVCTPVFVFFFSFFFAYLPCDQLERQEEAPGAADAEGPQGADVGPPVREQQGRLPVAPRPLSHLSGCGFFFPFAFSFLKHQTSASRRRFDRLVYQQPGPQQERRPLHRLCHGLSGCSAVLADAALSLSHSLCLARFLPFSFSSSRGCTLLPFFRLLSLCDITHEPSGVLSSGELEAHARSHRLVEKVLNRIVHGTTLQVSSALSDSDRYLPHRYPSLSHCSAFLQHSFAVLLSLNLLR